MERGWYEGGRVGGMEGGMEGRKKKLIEGKG